MQLTEEVAQQHAQQQHEIELINPIALTARLLESIE